MNGSWKRTLSAGLAVCLLTSCGMSAAREIPVSSETGEEISVQWTEEEETDFLEGLTAFTCETASEFLSGWGWKTNHLYSPASLYLALAMTAQCAAGDTQSQLLELLGAEDLETFANSSAAWFEGLCRENDEGTAALANSIWLREGFPSFPEPIEKLNQLYSAQAFEADFADAALPKDIGKWVKEATHGLLGKDAANFQPGADTQMILFSTLYFKSAWSDPFSKENNSEGTFIKADRMAVLTDYMNQWTGGLYWEGDGFTAGSRSMQNGADMLFVLPKEELSPEDLAAHPEVLRQILFPEGPEYAEITWRVPKFSISDSLADIPSTLESLGLTLPFSPNEADFSVLSDTPLYLSDIRQEATLTIDEEGCEGAAYTEVWADTAAAPPPKEVTMDLNRPFLFAVVYRDTVLFTGIINDPAAQ